LIASLFRAAGITLHGNDVFGSTYWTDGAIRRIPLDGGAAETLTFGQNPLYLAADDANVWFATFYDHPSTPADDRGIWRYASATRDVAHLLEGPVPAGLPIDADGVYTADLTKGTLVRISPNGDVRGLARQSDVTSVSADGGHVYFTSSSGTVGRVAKAGGPIAVLALGPIIDPYTSFMTVDDTSVYWTADEKIWRTSK
jgi:hypothetical protein